MTLIGSSPSQKIQGTDPLAQAAGAQVNKFLSTNKGTGATTGSASTLSSRSLAPPKSSPTKTSTSVVPKTSTSKPAAASGGGGGNTYGLNTKSSAPFNPYTSETVGQFNQGVLAAAKQQYLPQQQAIAGGINAEDTANTERTADLGGIYNQDATQQGQAFQDVKNAITGLINQNAGGDAASQATLSAALGSANAPGSSLAQMMGITEPQQSSPTPYNLAALGANNAGQNELSQVAAGLVANAGQGEANVGTEQAQQMNTESQRHQAALEGYQGQSQALSQQIPGYIDTARQTAVTNAQNAASGELQDELAQQEFNLSAQGQAFNQNLDTAKLTNQEQQFNANENLQWNKLAQNKSNLDLSSQKLQTQIDEFNTNTSLKLAGLKGAQSKNVGTAIESYLTPTKEETGQVTSTNSQGSTVKKTTVDQNAYMSRMNPGQLAAQLQSSYGLSREQALQAMSGIGVKFGDGSQSMGQWAKQQIDRIKGNAAVKGVTGTA